MNKIMTVGVGLAAVLGMAACSSSSKTDKSTVTTAASTTTTVKSNQNVAADQAAAQAAALKLSDFPSGWTSQPQSDDTENSTLQARLANCLGVSEAQFTSPPAHYQSPDFSDSNDNTASSEVGYRATAAEQAPVFALFASPKTPGCFSEAVTAAVNQEAKHPSDPNNTLPPNLKFGTATVSPMSFPSYGDKSLAYRVKVPITYQGLSIDAYVDLVVAIKGRADVLMDFEATSNPFPTDQEQHYTGLVVSRLTNT
jgi:hypothetical protein